MKVRLIQITVYTVKQHIKKSGALFILVLIPYRRRHHRQLILIIMAFNYQPSLLAPYLALSQGSSIQAECVYCSLFPFFPLKIPL
jgi:hypothetical protein